MSNPTLRQIPPTLWHYTVPHQVVERSGDFLAERGRQGLEAVVLWLGLVADERRAVVLVELTPPQVAYAGEDGVAVQVPDEVIAELLRSLPVGIFVLCRLHSHPREAYHSEQDDTNMIISHRGAISIVVPHFAQQPIGLERCSVNELGEGHRWRELSRQEIRERFEVIT
jgi:hypothetical protein